MSSLSTPIYLTVHAELMMKQRRIKVERIADIINNGIGELEENTNCWKFKHRGMVVVLDPPLDTVITVYHDRLRSQMPVQRSTRSKGGRMSLYDQSKDRSVEKYPKQSLYS